LGIWDIHNDFGIVLILFDVKLVRIDPVVEEALSLADAELIYMGGDDDTLIR
jgi:hypothetical protein